MDSEQWTVSSGQWTENSSKALFVGCATDIPPYTEYNNLPEPNRLGVCHPKGIDPSEIRAQNAGTIAKLLEGNNEDQYAVLHQPVMRVFEKQPFHAPVPG